MGRMIEVQQVREGPSSLTIQTGDVLVFSVAGGHVRTGGDVVDMIGPLLAAVVGDNGAVLTPMGAPNRVLFRARQAGYAVIDVIVGDAWSSPTTVVLNIVVEEGSRGYSA